MRTMLGLAQRTAPWLARGACAHQRSLQSMGRPLFVNPEWENCFQRRRFLTLPKLPNLPNLLKPISSSRQYKDRTLIKYSQQEFYDVVANVDDYQEFLPWCTYSKMSEPLPAGSGPGQSYEVGGNKSADGVSNQGLVTVRHGELGIGFNSLQERYVSNVTCQEPWTVRAVSYDSKLFKELSTTWRFTPNVPTRTTLQATMDQELQERQLLTRPAEEPRLPVKSKPSAPPRALQSEPKHQFTAAAVFGAAVVPKAKKAEGNSPANVNSAALPSAQPSAAPKIPQANSVMPPPSPSPESHIPTQQQPLPSPPKQTIQRTASPSNLATMKPSDYPSCWVDFDIQFEFASPVHASMSSLFFDQVSKEMLKAFIDRAEELYGKR
ncbi:Coenzyme Q-binding protein coq10a, mitochondrial [Dissophora ornata]|nr:Coenzyme Q-binding protein coq10a, mitochondrial [Dissophora ornata]